MKREICEHCGQYKPLIYKYFLDDMDISAISKIYRAIVEQNSNKIKITSRTIPDLSDGERHRITQLRFHALLAKVKHPKTGKQIGGTWCLTKRASDFLSKGLEVPEYVLTKQNQVIGHSPKLVSRSNFRILDDFRATYEIVDDRLEKIQESRQANLFNN